MFTGLVEEVGTLARLDRLGPSALVTIQCKLGAASPLALGESVSVAGVCLTVTRATGDGFTADVSAETLAKTTLGQLGLPSKVNLERAMVLGGRMGGHVVLGHVDGAGRVVDVTAAGEARRVTFETGRDLARYLAQKGAICVDGVSLTVNGVTDTDGAVRFDVMLVPHTLAMTTLPSLTKGSLVNLEIDIFARYVERHLGLLGREPKATDRDRDSSDADQRLLETLRRAGLA